MFFTLIVIPLLTTIIIGLVGFFQFDLLVSCFSIFDFLQQLNYVIDSIQFMASVEVIILGPRYRYIHGDALSIQFTILEVSSYFASVQCAEVEVEVANSSYPILHHHGLVFWVCSIKSRRLSSVSSPSTLKNCKYCILKIGLSVYHTCYYIIPISSC